MNLSLEFFIPAFLSFIPFLLPRLFYRDSIIFIWFVSVSIIVMNIGISFSYPGVPARYEFFLRNILLLSSFTYILFALHYYDSSKDCKLWSVFLWLISSVSLAAVTFSKFGLLAAWLIYSGAQIYSYSTPDKKSNKKLYALEGLRNVILMFSVYLVYRSSKPLSIYLPPTNDNLIGQAALIILIFVIVDRLRLFPMFKLARLKKTIERISGADLLFRLFGRLLVMLTIIHLVMNWYRRSYWLSSVVFAVALLLIIYSLLRFANYSRILGKLKAFESLYLSIILLSLTIKTDAADNVALMFIWSFVILFSVLDIAVYKIELNAGGDDPDKIGDMLKRVPFTAVIFFIGMLSVGMLPPSPLLKPVIILSDIIALRAAGNNLWYIMIFMIFLCLGFVFLITSEIISFVLVEKQNSPTVNKKERLGMQALAAPALLFVYVVCGLFPIFVYRIKEKAFPVNSNMLIFILILAALLLIMLYVFKAGKLRKILPDYIHGTHQDTGAIGISNRINHEPLKYTRAVFVNIMKLFGGK